MCCIAYSVKSKSQMLLTKAFLYALLLIEYFMLWYSYLYVSKGSEYFFYTVHKENPTPALVEEVFRSFSCK